MSRSPLSLDVLIVGAGLGGLAASIAISLSGHRVRIVEQAHHLSEVGAGIQVPPNSSRILARWGLAENFAQASVSPRSFCFRSYVDGSILCDQPLNPSPHGFPYSNVHRADYHNLLVARARDLGVSILLNHRVATIDFSAPSLTLTTGETLTADLIIGADGLKSVSRSLLLRRPDPPHLTGDLAYRITIPSSEMRKDPLLAPLVAEPRVNVWMGPNAHCVCYLLKGGELYNIVACCPDDLPTDTAIAPADPAEVRAFFASWDPVLRRAVALGEGFSKWRLQNSREMRDWGHEAGRFVLLGDACHATLPYLAQGAAMAVEDGAVLGALLGMIQSREEVAEVLKVYERVRKPRATRVVEGSSSQRKVYHMVDGPEREERDRVVKAADANGGKECPVLLRNSEFNNWLWSYDAYAEAERGWNEHLRRKARSEKEAKKDSASARGWGAWLRELLGVYLRLL